MKLFNIFQILGFWSGLPFGAQWLHQHDYSVYAVCVLVVWFVGFVAVSNIILNE